MPPEISPLGSCNSPAGELILAVDSGGTKTAACLAMVSASGKPSILGEGRSSAGNPLSVGFDLAADTIAQAVEAARQASRLDDRRPARAVLSIAGTANREMADRFAAWAKSTALADRVALVSDVLPILAAGSPDACGLALISGTGSSAFARAADGRSARRGGWGFMLGDEGSGYALGRAALRLALDSMESSSRSSASPSPSAHSDYLAQKVLSLLEVNTVPDLTRVIYSSPNPRHAVASLAPLVTDAAEQGDSAARSVLRDAATDLARLAFRAARAVGLEQATTPLALAGSVLTNSAYLQEELLGEISALELHCELRVVTNPLLGCLRLADSKFAGSLVSWSD
ncbi:MAG: hypothetical protein IT425_12205 [Pirellulales bacterium]|nr:hypothetical protein [Pirellulales bacterium]